MSENNTTSRVTSFFSLTGIGTLVTLVLMCGKLFAGANLSWLVVFLPLIIGLSLSILIIFFVICWVVLAGIILALVGRR